MTERNTAIDPKPIVSFMLAVAMGLWASQLVNYFTPDRDTKQLREQYKKAKNEYNDSKTAGDTANKTKNEYNNAKDKYFKAGEENGDFILNDFPYSWLLPVASIFFLVDLLCIAWWYAKYIYRVQPKAEFKTYFLDFFICSMCALAANSWTKSIVFLLAASIGSGFLIWRFHILYNSSSVSSTDKQLLRKVFKLLRLALAIAVPSALCGLLIAVLGTDTSEMFVLRYIPPVLVTVLSLIGIGLTWYLKDKIDVAVSIYSAKHSPISTAYLAWPTPELPDDEHRKRIRQQTKKGLEKFDNLFSQIGKYDRIHSRVHSDTELRIQSYILALPSCEKQEYAEEIEKKAFIVALSHWLDDLVDGRSEVYVWEQLQKNGGLLSDEEDKAEQLFEKIYKPLIVKHTDEDFYELLHNSIRRACSSAYNLKYMLLGLNRVAYGSAIFSTKLTNKQRQELLDDHNNFIKKWNVAARGKFEEEVEGIINEISAGDEGDPGPILLGLTTKTVQEMALSSEAPLSSEEDGINIGLSILFSILYAPLIYYHNIRQELENDEMIPLQAFDIDSDVWIPWLVRTRKAINAFENGDGRKQMRLKQIEMAYRCFKPLLPSPIAAEISDVYLP